MTENIKTRAMNSVGAMKILCGVKRAALGLRKAKMEKIAPSVASSMGRVNDGRIRETIISLENAELINLSNNRGRLGAELSLTDAGWDLVGGKPALGLVV